VGLNAVSGAVEKILQPLWSHEEFHFDVATGELLQDNANSKDRYDRYIRRYIGVVIQTTSDNAVRSSSASTISPSEAKSPLPAERVAANAKPPVRGKGTAHRSSIEAAIAAIWPEGLPEGLTVRDRDGQINDWQDKNGQVVTSGKTIQRHLKGE